MSWITIARTEQIPKGRPWRCTAAGRALLLVKTGGKLFAISEVCTHEASSLAEGLVEDNTIECPRHGALFDLQSGKPLSLPATGRLRTYPLRVEGDTISVQIETQSEVNHG
jgi:3-phenylpropionate/trans-cinnamate dioxygenase ferredoxin component